MPSNNLFQVSDEFIDEGKKLDRTRQKTGGPYSKKDRYMRRQEVYRLHFEYGYSAVKVSELMKINRHTIDNDIKYWYSKLNEQWDTIGHGSRMQTHHNRMEAQRTRLCEDLEKYKDDFEKKMVIEKLILEIDTRLNHSTHRVFDTDFTKMKEAVILANKQLEESGITNRRLYSPWEFILTSEEQRKAINKILNR